MWNTNATDLTAATNLTTIIKVTNVTEETFPIIMQQVQRSNSCKNVTDATCAIQMQQI